MSQQAALVSHKATQESIFLSGQLNWLSLPFNLEGGEIYGQISIMERSWPFRHLLPRRSPQYSPDPKQQLA